MAKRKESAGGEVLIPGLPPQTTKAIDYIVMSGLRGSTKQEVTIHLIQKSLPEELRSVMETEKVLQELGNPERKLKETQRGALHRKTVSALASDGKGALFSAGEDGVVNVWDDELKKKAKFIGEGGPIYDMACSPDGQKVAWVSGESNDLVLCEVSTGETRAFPLATLKGKEQEKYCQNGHTPWAVAYSPAGQIAAGGMSMRTKVFRLLPREKAHTLKENPQAWESNFGARVLAFNADGSVLAKGEDGTDNLELWDPKNGKRISVFGKNGDYVEALSFHPTEKNILATGSFVEDGGTRLWNIRSGKHEFLGRQEKNDCVHDVRFDPSGEVLISVGSDDTVRIFDVDRKTCIKKVKAEQKGVRAVTFVTPETFATGGSDGTIRTWNLKELLGKARKAAHLET